MIITCPRCSTRYVIDPAVLDPNGRAVGCSNCGHHWTEPPPAAAPAPDEPAAPPGAAAPEPPPPPPEETPEETPEGAASPAEPPAEPSPAEPSPAEPSPAEPSPAEPSPAEPPPAEPPSAEPPSAEPPSDAGLDSGDLPNADSGESSLSRPLDPAPPGMAAPPVGVESRPDAAGAAQRTAGRRQEDAADAAEAPEPAADPEPIPAALRKSGPPGRRDKPDRKKMPSVALLAAIGGLAALSVIAVVFVAARGPIVSAVPAAAGLYRGIGLLGDEFGAGLEIRDVRSARRRDGADEILTIEGIVANVTDEPLDLPVIRVSVSDADAEELQFVTVRPETASLPPGETVAFEARIVNPSALVRRVKVKFTAPDAAATQY